MQKHKVQKAFLYKTEKFEKIINLRHTDVSVLRKKKEILICTCLIKSPKKGPNLSK